MPDARTRVAAEAGVDIPEPLYSASRGDCRDGVRCSSPASASASRRVASAVATVFASSSLAVARMRRNGTCDALLWWLCGAASERASEQARAVWRTSTLSCLSRPPRARRLLSARRPRGRDPLRRRLQAHRRSTCGLVPAASASRTEAISARCSALSDLAASVPLAMARRRDGRGRREFEHGQLRCHRLRPVRAEARNVPSDSPQCRHARQSRIAIAWAPSTLHARQAWELWVLLKHADQRVRREARSPRCDRIAMVRGRQRRAPRAHAPRRRGRRSVLLIEGDQSLRGGAVGRRGFVLVAWCGAVIAAAVGRRP